MATKSTNKSTVKEIPIRGYLLHITHYDPRWCAVKDKEEPFDLDIGLELLEEMAKAKFNLLLIDTKDGVKYKSHPELTRPYSQPIEILAKLRDRAAQHGIELAIKLNFSQSELHQHNHWFRPHNSLTSQLFERPEYFRLAFEVIDELLEAVRPPRFFHIGMDEDHWRSYRQYVEAIRILNAGLKKRKLRTIIWNDSASDWPEAEIHKDKSLAAEQSGPRDVIHVLWDYKGVNEEALRRIRGLGLELWGAPGSDPKQIAGMRDALKACGGTGLLCTHWIPCVRANREKLIERICTVGPVFAG